MLKKQQALLEQASELGYIDLYYGDETRISEEGYVPYGWQFKDEDVFIPVQRGKGLNCFGLLSREMKFHYEITDKNINADFIVQYLDRFSFSIKKETVVVLDNASCHRAKKVKERLQYWQNRGLYVFFLPPYSPQLNIIERLWKEVKERWLRPCDYSDFDCLSYAISRVFASIGGVLNISFGSF